jgi:hypothetical protein
VWAQYVTILAGIIMFSLLDERTTEREYLQLVIVCSFASLFSWIYYLYWQKLSGNYFLDIVVNVLSDTKQIMYFFLIIFFAWSSQILIYDRFFVFQFKEEAKFFPTITGSEMSDAFINALSITIGYDGNFEQIQELTDYSAEKQETVYTYVQFINQAIFWVAVIFCNLLLNNLLIGIMYDSYQRLNEEAEKVKNFSKIIVHSDYISCCKEDANITNHDYVFVCESVQPEVEDEGSIEGTNKLVKELQQSVQKLTEDVARISEKPAAQGEAKSKVQKAVSKINE